MYDVLGYECGITHKWEGYWATILREHPIEAWLEEKYKRQPVWLNSFHPMSQSRSLSTSRLVRASERSADRMEKPLNNSKLFH